MHRFLHYSQRHHYIGKTIISLFILILLTTMMIPEPTYAEDFWSNVTDLFSEDEQVPQEIKSARTAKSKLYDNGDGTFTKKVFFQPIHRKIGEQWIDISTKLIKKEAGVISLENTEIDTQFAEKMTKGTYMSLFKGDHVVDFSFLEAEGINQKLSAQETTAQYSNNQILYENVVPGVNLESRIYNTTVKENIVLSRYNGLNRFHFQLKTDLNPKIDDAGNLLLLDAKGNEIYQLPKPYMTDSKIDPKSGEPSISSAVEFSLTKQETSWILTVEADDNWLKDPARQYPLYIDPSIIQKAQGYEDTYVSSAYPNQVYVLDNELKAGYYDSSTGTNHTYVKFDLDDLVGVKVDYAALNLYTKHTYDPEGSRVYLDVVKDTFYASELTWNNAQSLSTTYLTNRYIKANEWATFNVTSTIQDLLDNSKLTWGFKLHTNGAGASEWTKFHANEYGSYEPYISITYHLPTPQNFTAVPYANIKGENTGYAYLRWDPVPGATGYKVGIFNGKEYQYFDVGNVADWTSQGKGIWPTQAEIEAGSYQLHTDGNGTELAKDPSPVYNNVPNGTYHGRTNYAFRVIAYHPKVESEYSVLTATIPERGEDLGDESYLMYAPVPGGKVNVITGNLLMEQVDTSTDGRGPVVAAKRFYNSNNNKAGLFGLGWTFNFAVSLKEEENGNVTLYEGDGTVHTFVKKPNNEYAFPLGAAIDLTKTSSGFTLKYKDQTEYLFDTSGKLVKIQDSDDNIVNLTYNTTNQLTEVSDASGRKTMIAYYADGKIHTITDSANHVWTYTYEGDLLTSETNPNNETVQFTYISNLLDTVTDPKGNATRYIYTNGKLTEVHDPLANKTMISYAASNKTTNVTSPDGVVTKYQYSASGNPQQVTVDPTGLNLVTKFNYELNYLSAKTDPNTNKAGETIPTSTFKYDRNGNLLEAVDPSGKITYQYDSKNNMISYTDANGETYNYSYDGTKKLSQINPAKASDANLYADNGNLLASTPVLGTAHNLIANPGFERPNETYVTFPADWERYEVGDTGSIERYNSVKYFGTRSVKINTSSTTSDLGVKAVTQEFPVEANKTYTLSGFIKTNLTNARAFFNVEQLKADGTPASTRWTDNRYSQLVGTHDWTKRQLTFNTAADTAKVRIYLEVDHQNASTSGSACFDNVQLEKSVVSSQPNPLENSSFEKNLNYWRNSLGVATIDSSQSYEGKNSLKMVRNNASDSAIQYVQTIDFKQNTAKPITITGISKASSVQNAISNGPNKDYSIYVDAILEDGTYATDQAKFSLDTHDWQRSAVTISPSKPIDYVNIYVLFRGNNTGIVWFDNIRIQDGNAITTYDYDEQGNYVISTKDPLGNTRQTTYDEVGNILSKTDPKGNTKNYTHDLAERLKTVIETGSDYKLNYTYDSNGNVTERTTTTLSGDKEYNRQTYVYDKGNRLLSTTDTLGKTANYAYDENGRLIKVTKPSLDTVEFGYDYAGRQTEVKHNGTVRFHASYDANGNVTETEDTKRQSITTRTFDKSNRLTNMSIGNNGSVAWTYDSNSNVTNQTVSNNEATYAFKYNYSPLNQNTTVTDPQNHLYRFDYNELGELDSITTGNGSGTTYIYNDNGYISSMTSGKSNGDLIAEYTYTHDSVGNRTSETAVLPDTGETIRNFTYDNRGQLLSETTTDSNHNIYYQYDVLGNRTSKTVKKLDGTVVSTESYTYNAKNQLTAVSGQTWSYDDNGHLIDDGTHQYVWDVEGRLIQVKKKSDSSIVAEYDYDANGRRIQSKAGSEITHFVYDGESNRVLYETDANGQMTRYYTYSNGGGLLSMTTKSDTTYTTYYYHYNGHGDVIAITDPSNNIVAEYGYDAWGNIVFQSGSMADENPYRYGGYRYDKETGLYYLHARYYTANYGRFLTPDPVDGEVDNLLTQNGYTYANNNPVNGTDPDGEYIPGSERGDYATANPYTGEIITIYDDYKPVRHRGRDVVDGHAVIKRDRVYARVLSKAREPIKIAGWIALNWDESIFDYKEMKEYKDKEFHVYGEFYKPDKFGNLAYGYYANQADYSLKFAREGAAAYQVIEDYRNDRLNCRGKTPSSCDDPEDVSLINEGYHMKFD